MNKPFSYYTHSRFIFASLLTAINRSQISNTVSNSLAPGLMTLLLFQRKTLLEILCPRKSQDSSTGIDIRLNRNYKFLYMPLDRSIVAPARYGEVKSTAQIKFLQQFFRQKNQDN